MLHDVEHRLQCFICFIHILIVSSCSSWVMIFYYFPSLFIIPYCIISQQISSFVKFLHFLLLIIMFRRVSALFIIVHHCAIFLILFSISLMFQDLPSFHCTRFAKGEGAAPPQPRCLIPPLTPPLILDKANAGKHWYKILAYEVVRAFNCVNGTEFVSLFFGGCQHYYQHLFPEHGILMTINTVDTRIHSGAESI